MLPPFIIEQIRKREEEERRRYEQQPHLELPLAPPHHPGGHPGAQHRRDDRDEGVQRGVIIVEL